MTKRKEARCPDCDWPLSKNGCSPESCSYRPEEGSAEWHRIRRKQKLSDVAAPSPAPQRKKAVIRDVFGHVLGTTDTLGDPGCTCDMFIDGSDMCRISDDCPLHPLTGAAPAVAPTPQPDGYDPTTETRWQNAIYELCKRAVGPENDHLIDGGGCDSGDALDFTLVEIGLAIGFWRDKYEVLAGGAVAETPPDADDHLEYKFIVRMFSISRNPPQTGAFPQLQALTKAYAEAVTAQLRENYKMVFEAGRARAEQCSKLRAEVTRLKAAHEAMHVYLREIGDSNCEFCEALAGAAKKGTP